MTIDLTQARKLLAAATPGDWEAIYDEVAYAFVGVDDKTGGYYVVADTIAEAGDAELIATAPTLIRSLITEIERLQAALTAAQGVIEVAEAIIAYDIKWREGWYGKTFPVSGWHPENERAALIDAYRAACPTPSAAHQKGSADDNVD